MDKRTKLLIRKRRVRTKISGRADRPRLSVHISLRQVSAQLIDDQAGRTIASVSSLNQSALDGKTMTQKASWVGEQIGKLAIKNKITEVVFDRNGRQYHGRMAALAEATRTAGVKF